MKIKYKGKILDVEQYGIEDYILQNGTIINESECTVMEDDVYDKLLREVASKIFVKLITSSVMLAPNNIEAMAENSISYTSVFINKLKNYEKVAQ